METIQSKPAILLYTEQTPNPESLKFVSNRILYKGIAEFKDPDAAKGWSVLAEALFGLEYVKSVYISNNFVTITKKPGEEWHEIMIPAKEFIRSFIVENADKDFVSPDFEQHKREIEKQNSGADYNEEDQNTVTRIKEIIEQYVKPAVEMDGGNIEFKSYQDGVVTVYMQGSCSGCPSSTVTLKAGIEGLMKRMLPSVREVVAEAQ
ncbi:MAG: NifU family protein [Saprospiraceae bacterium]|nr:NifU family protein [Saprospiraceae bacterium]